MDLWQLIGTASLVAVLLLGLLILIRNPTDSTLSISNYIASKQHYFWIMGLALTFGGAVFYGFIVFWLIPHYELPAFTYWLLLVAFIGQLCVAWIPTTRTSPRWKRYLHNCGGLTVGTVMVACLWIVATTGNSMSSLLSDIVLAAAWLTTFFYILMIIALLRYSKLMLPSEALMIFVFSIALLVLAWEV